MGPFPLENGGTLKSEDRQKILQATGVSASARWRQQWQQRCLSLSGPASGKEEAKQMAYRAIEAHGTEGGGAPEPKDAPAPKQEAQSSKAANASTADDVKALWQEVFKLQWENHGLTQTVHCQTHELQSLRLNLEGMRGHLHGHIAAATQHAAMVDRRMNELAESLATQKRKRRPESSSSESRSEAAAATHSSGTGPGAKEADAEEKPKVQERLEVKVEQEAGAAEPGAAMAKPLEASEVCSPTSPAS